MASREVRYQRRDGIKGRAPPPSLSPAPRAQLRCDAALVLSRTRDLSHDTPRWRRKAPRDAPPGSRGRPYLPPPPAGGILAQISGQGALRNIPAAPSPHAETSSRRSLPAHAAGHPE